VKWRVCLVTDFSGKRLCSRTMNYNSSIFYSQSSEHTHPYFIGFHASMYTTMASVDPPSLWESFNMCVKSSPVLFCIILNPSVSPSKVVGLILQKGIGEELFRFGTPISVLMYL